MIIDAELDRALQLAIGTRKDRIRAEKALEVLRAKEDRAANELETLVKQRTP